MEPVLRVCNEAKKLIRNLIPVLMALLMPWLIKGLIAKVIKG